MGKELFEMLPDVLDAKMLWMEQHTNKAKQAGAGKEKKADETDKV